MGFVSEPSTYLAVTTIPDTDIFRHWAGLSANALSKELTTAACVAAINTGSATAARPRAGNHCRGSSYGHHRYFGVG